MAVISAFLSRLLADEFKAWTPQIVQYLSRCAVLTLPEELRERHQEEWASHLNEIPGSLGKLFTAGRFLFAAKRMLVAVGKPVVQVQTKMRNSELTFGLLP